MPSKKSGSGNGKQTIHRSSISGKFVTEKHVRKNPRTTQTEKR
ncbi:hypothetical protein LCGC14_0177610 [marine sediment metagenome]|uniref:Uncharacterized protein n=1 Tax=marine sediment metagenome TaxID=412755 RepID=A0A0F9X964_9ZZZZ